MKKNIGIGIIGDFNEHFVPHIRTNEAISHASKKLNIITEVDWLPTKPFEQHTNIVKLQDYDALWCAPGSPYQSLDGAINAIKYARESNVPLLGTCGGFQHMVIEYARNVLGFKDAQHAEYDPYASQLFISELSCSLAGEKMTVNILENSGVYQYYQKPSVDEEYYCNFGLDPKYQKELDQAGLNIVGVDQDGEARILEIPSHSFFVATLFVPQITSTPDKPHPLILNFLKIAMGQ
jgi:CTP synthase (UTP-ammonia lyase)